MQPMRQGDVILLPIQTTVPDSSRVELGQKLLHLMLAAGENSAAVRTGGVALCC